MTKRTQDTWVLVADGEKALFLTNLTDAEDPHLDVREKDTQDNPKDTDQSANRPGRQKQIASPARSAYDDTDWHELAKDRFAADLAEQPYQRVHAGTIKRLVLVAAPSVLGELRQSLHRSVEAVIVGEIDKTLTNHPIPEIEAILKAELAT